MNPKNNYQNYSQQNVFPTQEAPIPEKLNDQQFQNKTNSPIKKQNATVLILKQNPPVEQYLNQKLTQEILARCTISNGFKINIDSQNQSFYYVELFDQFPEKFSLDVITLKRNIKNIDCDIQIENQLDKETKNELYYQCTYKFNSSYIQSIEDFQIYLIFEFGDLLQFNYNQEIFTFSNFEDSEQFQQYCMDTVNNIQPFIIVQNNGKEYKFSIDRAKLIKYKNQIKEIDQPQKKIYSFQIYDSMEAVQKNFHEFNHQHYIIRKINLQNIIEKIILQHEIAQIHQINSKDFQLSKFISKLEEFNTFDIDPILELTKDEKKIVLKFESFMNSKNNLIEDIQTNFQFSDEIAFLIKQNDSLLAQIYLFEMFEEIQILNKLNDIKLEKNCIYVSTGSQKPSLVIFPSHCLEIRVKWQIEDQIYGIFYNLENYDLYEQYKCYHWDLSIILKTYCQILENYIN